MGRAPLRRDCDPHSELLPTLGAKEPIALLARLFARPGDVGRRRLALLSRARAQRARGRPGRERARLTPAARGCPTRRDPVGTSGDRVGRQPAQPDRRNRSAGAAGGARRALPAPRRDPRGGRDVLRVLVRRRAAGVGFGAGAAQRRRRVQLAVQALVAGRAALGVRGRRRRHRAAHPPPPQRHRHDAAGARAARVDRRVGRRGPRDPRARALRAQARRCCAPRRCAQGSHDAGGPGGIFLWLRVPGGDDVRAHELLLDRSLLVVPGSYLGTGGKGYLRVALTPPGRADRRVRAELLAAIDLAGDATSATPWSRTSSLSCLVVALALGEALDDEHARRARTRRRESCACASRRSRRSTRACARARAPRPSRRRSRGSSARGSRRRRRPRPRPRARLRSACSGCR